MIRNILPSGLIVCTAARRTAALDELIDCLDWPAVAAATPRRLRDELLPQDLQCLLFWLEDHRETNATVNLIAWLRNCWPEIYRIAIAYRLGVQHEAAIRAAGAQTYLPATADIHAVVDEAVMPLLEREGLVPISTERARPPTQLHGAPPDWGELREVNHPP